MINEYTENLIFTDFLRGKLSRREICDKYSIGITAFNRIEGKFMVNHQSLKNPISVHAFEKRTAYFESVIDYDGSEIDAESIMLSSPFYNPADLSGWELQIFNNIQNEKSHKNNSDNISASGMDGMGC